MEKNYDYTRSRLIMPEYGRHIHTMVQSIQRIEDRAARNRQARAVIAVMGNLNPLLRDTADYAHKLWDHLFIMADFQLDVDSPYPQPTRDELTLNPERLRYPQRHVTYKHYGRHLPNMLKQITKEEDQQLVDKTVDSIARYMRTKSYEYNQEHPSNEVIVKEIKQMTGDGIELDEVALNNLRSDYKNGQIGHQQRGVRTAKNNKQRNGRNQPASPYHNNNQQGSGHNTSHRNFSRTGGQRRNVAK